MAGDQLERTRVIVSKRLIAPTSCCENIDDKAMSFRLSLATSARTERLIPDIAVKALTGSGEQRQTYEDTDNKKREFTGDSQPGVEVNDRGYRWETAKKKELGDQLFLFPSVQSRRGLKTGPNFGWINPEKEHIKTFRDILHQTSTRPGIQLTKHKVNSKTGDIIPGSEKQIDSFAMFSGQSMEERRAKHKKYFETHKKFGTQEEKILGRSLRDLIPGGNLIARAAAAIGILVDENNKFRCPPGTPAANQFTDALGTTCFGFSPSRFVRFARRMANEMEGEGALGGFRERAQKMFNYWYNDVWDGTPWMGPRDAAFIERVAYWESISGDRFKPPAWRNIPIEDNLRAFRNGFARGQDSIAKQKFEVRELISRMGIDPDDEDAVFQAVERLGIEIVDGNRIDGESSGRMLPVELRTYIESRLTAIPGWNALTPEEQTRMIDSDVRRYKETEKALFETLLHQHLVDPENTKFFGRIVYDFFSDDEANTSLYTSYKPQLVRTPDGEIVFDDEGNPVTRVVPVVRGQITINMNRIMDNQETMLPNMAPDERLSISAVGARTDAEAKMRLADFMINADHTARGMAGLIDGVYSFSSHIMLHEISHGHQAQAFMDRISDDIRDYGHVRVPIYDKKTGVVRGFRKVASMDELTSDDVMAIFLDVADDINLRDLGDALQRIADVAPIAGAYPSQYAEGSEVWAFEASAELWALRERGIIFGEDIDRALEWMDRRSASRTATTRATAADDAAEAAADDDYAPIPDSPVPDMPEEDLDAALEEAAERSTASAREELTSFKESVKTMDEDELIGEAAIIALQSEAADELIKTIEADAIDPSLPDDEKTRLEAVKSRALRQATLMRDLHKAKYDAAKKQWAKSYGLGDRSDAKRFEDEVRRARDAAGLLSEADKADIARRARIDDAKVAAEKMSEKQLIRAIADGELLIKTLESRSRDSKLTSEITDVFRDEYIKRALDSGDTRTPAQIKRALDKTVKDTISPPPKPVKRFTDAKDARNNAARERKRLKATKTQKDALLALGDIKEADVGMLLDPKVQTRAGRAMNERNRRLKRLGLEVDELSPEQADMPTQVEKLLIPAMEAIDSSSISQPFEMEAIVDFPDGSIRGEIDGKEVDVDTFTSGRVVVKRMKKLDMPEKGIRDKETKRTSRRVIVEVREGDRGIFPRAGEGEQKFVIPPGKLRIIGVEKDGTIRAEISSQKDTVQVVDSLADSVANGDKDKIWRDGAGIKLKKVADKYAAKRYAEGYDGKGGRTDDSTTGADVSTSVVDSVVESGSSFGEYLDGGTDGPPTAASLSSGATHFRPNQTRSTSRSQRQSTMSKNIDNLKDILTGRDGDGSITRADLDDDVARLIATTPEPALIQMAEDAAVRLHNGFDRRVRVRARDEDIDEILRTGGMRSPLSGPTESARTSRRVERRLASSGQSSRKLSSGSVSEAKLDIEARKEKEKEVATRATKIFTDIVNSEFAKTGKTIDDLTDDELKPLGIARSARKAISADNANVYTVENVETAVALLMLGHHVELTNKEDLRLTEQASQIFEKMVQDEAKKLIDSKDNPKWKTWLSDLAAETPEIRKPLKDYLDGKADWASIEENLRKKLEKDFIKGHQADLCQLYDPTKNLMCSGNLGIDRAKMPQLNGRTLSHDTLAIRALKDGRVAGKWEPASKLTRNAEVEKEFAEEWAAKIAESNAQLVAEGKAELDEAGELKVLYNLIADKHSLKNEHGEVKQTEHRTNSWMKLSDAAKQWLYDNTNWNDTEANFEEQFMQLARELLGPDAVKRVRVDASTYAPSQQQLVASKMDDTSKSMIKAALKIGQELEDEGYAPGTKTFSEMLQERMSKQWFMQPILVTRDGFILDGHHRWGGMVLANRTLPEYLQLQLNANEVQTDILEGLTLGKVMQDRIGVKEARLGAELDYVPGEISPLKDGELEDILSDIAKTAPEKIDEIYRRGDYVKLGSHGMLAKPDYAQAAKQRQLEVSFRERLGRAEQTRMGLERDTAVRRGERLSSGRTRTGANNEPGGTRTALSSGRAKDMSKREMRRHNKQVLEIQKEDEFNQISPETSRLGPDFVKERWDRFEAHPERDSLRTVNGSTMSLVDMYDSKQGHDEFERVFGEPFSREAWRKRVKEQDEKRNNLLNKIEQEMIAEGITPRPTTRKELEEAGQLRTRVYADAVHFRTLSKKEKKELDTLMMRSTMNIPGISDEDRKQFVSAAKTLLNLEKVNNFGELSNDAPNMVTGFQVYDGRKIAPEIVHAAVDELEKLGAVPKSRADIIRKELIDKYEIDVNSEKYKTLQRGFIATESLMRKRLEKKQREILIVPRYGNSIDYERDLLDIMADNAFPPAMFAQLIRDTSRDRRAIYRSYRSKYSLSSGKNISSLNLADESDKRWFTERRMPDETNSNIQSAASVGARTLGINERRTATLKPRNSQIGIQDVNNELSNLKIGGLAHDEFSRSYFESIGLNRNTDTNDLPISGYLIHRSHVNARNNAIREGSAGNLSNISTFEIGDKDLVGDGLTAHGDIEIVLKPSVSHRTAYGRGNAMADGHKPVLLNSRNKDDIADAILSYDDRNKQRSNEALISLLSASIDDDFSRVNAQRKENGSFLKTGRSGNSNDAPRMPYEAQILGGFDVNEIEQINFPFTRLQEMAELENIDDIVNDRSIAERLRSAGFSQEEIEYFYSIDGAKSLNTESMAMLRNYRAAKRLKDSYAQKGLQNVKIAHPQGFDMDNPNTYAKGNRAGQSIESILRTAIMREITDEAEKMIKEMRKPKRPNRVSRRGGLL